MVHSLLLFTSFLLLIVNGASMSRKDMICASRCRLGKGGALCHCSLTHFSGKRSESDVGTNPYRSPPYSVGRGNDQNFAERETTLESDDYRLHDLAEVIDRLASQGQDDVSKQFGSDKRVDTAFPPSSMDMSPRIPQILLEFNRMLKTRGAPVDRDNFKVLHHASRPADDDGKWDSMDEKQGLYRRNLHTKSIDDEGVGSETDNQDMLQDKVAETVREIMESNHLQEDPFTAHGHQESTESDFYRDHKRSHADTIGNDRPGLQDATEDEAAGYNTNRKSKDGHLLKQIDMLLRQVYRKGSSNLPSLEVFDNKVATS